MIRLAIGPLDPFKDRISPGASDRAQNHYLESITDMRPHLLGLALSQKLQAIEVMLCRRPSPHVEKLSLLARDPAQLK